MPGFAKAEKEFRSAEKNLPIKEYELVAFLSQQAAEKRPLFVPEPPRSPCPL